MTDQTTANAILTAARETDWSPTQQCVLNAMSAKWYASLTAPHIQRIAEALENLEAGSLVNTQKTLTALVRRKVLRSRSIRGVTHYEINY